ncbi:MAG: TonB family protein [Novosphingobium sp.]|nr:TonB family protein [Novosphingobium sp.]
MAYVDKRPGGNRTAVIATVALLHGIAIYALVSGLGVKYVKEITTVIRGENIPFEPPPPPPEPQPSAKPKNDDTVLVVPKPDIDVPRTSDTVFEVPGLPVPSVPKGPVLDFVPKPPEPPKPTPSFTPKSATPRNSPAGWVSTNDYPSRDLREGNQGVARFSLVIGADGKVESCVVTQSTGSGGLDDATCKYVSRRARFDPATDANGKRVTGSYNGSIRWVIPE